VAGGGGEVKKSKPEVSRKQEEEENIRRVDYKADAARDKKKNRIKTLCAAVSIAVVILS
jgi:hypothetical protein